MKPESSTQFYRCNSTEAERPLNSEARRLSKIRDDVSNAAPHRSDSDFGQQAWAKGRCLLELKNSYPLIVRAEKSAGSEESEVPERA